MPNVKRIVCLANSYKYPNGRCVAGREMLGNEYGGWIRPISERPTAELSISEYIYENNSSPKPMDIIDIPLLRVDPRHHQIENYVIDTGRWIRQGILPFSELDNLCDQPESLWINSQHTQSGYYDCITQDEAASVQGSLMLIKVQDLRIEVGRNYWNGKRSYRAQFHYGGVYHDLSVTDPIVRSAFSARQEGNYQFNDVYLCISLTEPYRHDNRCHKVVAAIIEELTL
jgi:hypothetical protein